MFGDLFIFRLFAQNISRASAHTSSLFKRDDSQCDNPKNKI
jgi:hypothetical protein